MHILNFSYLITNFLKNFNDLLLNVPDDPLTFYNIPILSPSVSPDQPHAV